MSRYLTTQCCLSIHLLTVERRFSGTQGLFIIGIRRILSHGGFRLRDLVSYHRRVEMSFEASRRLVESIV